jgi:hypothetical protein
MALKDRIEGRQFAEMWLNEMVEHQDPDFKRGVATACRSFSQDVLPVQRPNALRVMDPKESRDFEKKKITFGMYEGEAFSDVPISYLEFLADSVLDIQAYLRGERAETRGFVEQKEKGGDFDGC